MIEPFSRRRPWYCPKAALGLLLAGATARTCLPVALVVGTVPSLVNRDRPVRHD